MPPTLTTPADRSTRRPTSVGDASRRAPGSRVAADGVDDRSTTSTARARWVDEPPKRPERTPFERDRARLVHSAALRRLAAKTQVVGPQTDDFVRNRLTHTLEVAQVARDLGPHAGLRPRRRRDRRAGPRPRATRRSGTTASGRSTRSARPCGGFEGNAQTLRILTRLEAKTFDDRPAARSG